MVGWCSFRITPSHEHPNPMERQISFFIIVLCFAPPGLAPLSTIPRRQWNSIQLRSFDNLRHFSRCSMAGDFIQLLPIRKAYVFRAEYKFTHCIRFIDAHSSKQPNYTSAAAARWIWLDGGSQWKGGTIKNWVELFALTAREMSNRIEIANLKVASHPRRMQRARQFQSDDISSFEKVFKLFASSYCSCCCSLHLYFIVIVDIALLINAIWMKTF